MKHTFGEYGAFTTKNSIRFQKDNKLVAEKDVPPEVVVFLRKKLDRPVEESSSPTPPPSPTLEPDGFPKQEPLEPMTVEEAAQALDASDFDEPEPGEPDPKEFVTAEKPDQTMEQPDEMSDFVESVSIHTAELADIAEALYERFGIYTVYLQRPPASDEVDPLTGVPFTKYHLGVAYQAAIRARNTGVFAVNPENHRQAIEEGRKASENRRDQYDARPKTQGEAAKMNTFAYRTSVRGTQKKVDKEIVHTEVDGVTRTERVESPSGTRTIMPDGRHDFDEPIAEPQLRKKVIRPDWNN